MSDQKIFKISITILIDDDFVEVADFVIPDEYSYKLKEIGELLVTVGNDVLDGDIIVSGEN